MDPPDIAALARTSTTPLADPGLDVELSHPDTDGMVRGVLGGYCCRTEPLPYITGVQNDLVGGGRDENFHLSSPSLTFAATLPLQDTRRSQENSRSSFLPRGPQIRSV